MKRFVALFAAAVVLFCLLISVSAEEIDYDAVYAPILASGADLLSAENPDSHILGPGETGIREIRGGLLPEDAIWNVGYAIQDLSGDGVPELILAQVDSQEERLSFGRRILAMFSCYGTNPSLILEGWGRNCYYLLPDGSILNQGSSGAAYSSLGLFRLSENADALECLDFFFTDTEDDRIITYHNQDGVWDASHEGNELVDVDFWRLSEIMEADIESLKLTSLYFYLEDNPSSLVLPQWYPEGFLEDFRQITLSTQPYSTKIALCAYNGAVTNLQLLSLELEDIDTDGTPHFKESILKDIPSLEQGDPVVVQLEFGCTIPNFGIRYTDSNGVTKACSIMQSGMDGSLVMNEIA